MKIVATTFIVGMLVVAGGPGDAVKKEMAQLEGEWTMVSGTADGQAMPDDILKTMKRSSKAGETTVKMGDQVFIQAKITIDPTKKPKTIDYNMTGGFTKGKTQLGIYELTGDTVKFCFASPDKERPTEFSSKAGSGWTLSEWKREKK